MTSRLSGIQPWYKVPSGLRTVILSRSGALHERNNGVPLLRLMKGCGQGAFGFFGIAKEEASWLTPDDPFSQVWRILGRVNSECKV